MKAETAKRRKTAANRKGRLRCLFQSVKVMASGSHSVCHMKLRRCMGRRGFFHEKMVLNTGYFPYFAASKMIDNTISLCYIHMV